MRRAIQIVPDSSKCACGTDAVRRHTVWEHDTRIEYPVCDGCYRFYTEQENRDDWPDHEQF